MQQLRHAVLTVLLLSTTVSGQSSPADPETYPDAAGFEQRKQVILDGLRLNTDLGTWRRGYFSGGDPGKYVPPVVYARLLANPDDADAIAIMNDGRSSREHYHFAALNWARFYPLMGDKVLTDATRQQFSDAAFRYNYLAPTGTENHKTMSMTSANVLPWYIDRGLSNKSKEETLSIAKQQLRSYAKHLYQSGQGEWDSSTYWAFTMNGMLNIYDFSKDEESRLIAKAAIDWFVAGYALKYRDGLFCGPNQRGHYDTPHDSIADRIGYLWYGSRADVAPAQMRRAFHTIEPITSRYRPNQVLYNIATKKLDGTPVQFNNTKPVYWYGLNIYPNPNAYAETVYIAPTYTMGTLFNGHGSQITRFQIVSDSPAGAVALTGGHPSRSDHKGIAEGFGYADGIGRYESTAQVGPVAMCVWNAPPDETIDYGFFSLPKDLKPTIEGDWAILQIDKTLVAVRGATSGVEVSETDLTEKQKSENSRDREQGKPERHQSKAILKFPGRQGGWIVETASTNDFADAAALAAALKQTAVEFAGPRDGSFAVRYRSLRNGTIDLTDTPDTSNAGVVLVDGKPLDYKSWKPIYDGPFIRQADGVLTVNDGTSGFIVDFTGDLPIYKPWTK
jgi:hypothetical protein